MITCTFENGNIASPGLRHITVNTLVIKDNQILLGLRAAVAGLNMLEVGKWALIGGFFDRDERLIEAVRREILEESGWEVDQVQLFRVNDSPDRPMEDRQNVDMIFIARGIKQVREHDQEVKELKWFSLNELPKSDQIAFDHGDSIQLYLEHLKSPKVLPILG